MQHLNYLKFPRAEWQDVEDKAKKQFDKLLGRRPSRRSIAKQIPNNHRLDTLNQLAILLLLIVAVFTAFKLGLTSIPLADRIVESNLHEGGLPPAIETVYRFSIVGSAMMVGTFGLIYFKLLAENSSTQKKIEATKRIKKYRLEYWSPRLPQLLVYVSMVMIIIVSNTANRNVFDWVFNNALVAVELALSYPVGVWMARRQARADVVTAELDKAVIEYDQRKEHYEQDTDYLRLLYQNAIEKFFNLKGSGRNRYPNREFMKADRATLERIIATEYKRLRGGMEFASRVNGWLENTVTEPQLPASSGLINTIQHRTNISSVPKNEPQSKGSRRTPPGSASEWNHDTLYADLLRQGAPKPLSESYVTDNYAPGHGARTVWRNSLKDVWNG